MWDRCHSTTTIVRQDKVKEHRKEWIKVLRSNRTKRSTILNLKFRSWHRPRKNPMIPKDGALQWTRFCKRTGNWQLEQVDDRLISNNQSRKDLPETTKAWVEEEQQANCFKEGLLNKWTSQHMNQALEQEWTDHPQDNQALARLANHQDKMTLEQDKEMELEAEQQHLDKARGMVRI